MEVSVIYKADNGKVYRRYSNDNDWEEICVISKRVQNRSAAAEIIASALNRDAA